MWIQHLDQGFPREGNGNPLHYSCLENTTDRRAWRATVHGITKSWTWMSTHNNNNISVWNNQNSDFWETSYKKVSHYGLTRQGDPMMILHFTLRVGIGHTYLNFSEILVLCLLLFSCSVMSDSFVTPWTLARRAPLPIWFSRQESWSGLQFLSPGDLPDPGIKPTSPALASRFFATEPPGKPK